MTDRFNTPIDDDIFPKIIENYHKAEGFYINFEFEVDFQKCRHIVTPFVSKAYLIIYSQWIFEFLTFIAAYQGIFGA